MKRKHQIKSRDVPGFVGASGTAGSNATLTLNYRSTLRQGEYYDFALNVPNGSAPQYPQVTVVSAYGATETKQGNLFVPQTPESFDHDADGNLTQDGRWTYTWDGENRLVALVARTSAGPQQSIRYDYDWQGRRVRKQVWDNTTFNGSPSIDVRFVYDGWNLLAVVDSDSHALQAFVWGLDLSGSLQGAGGVGGLLEVTDFGSSPGTHFVAYDGNGNVAALVDAGTGATTASFEYGPFGEPVRVTGSKAAACPFRFSTKFTDDESGLLYYGYRSYSPSIGRWLSRDPIGEEGGEDLYTFVFNAPIDKIDPVGFAACKSNYKWLVHPPMRDRDLQSAQRITVNTTLRIGENSTVVPRPMSFSGFWGLTITQPSLVGGDCCCSSSGGYKPTFDLIVHSQIYLLDRRSSAWGVDRMNSGDPSVDDYWYHSPQWYRRHLVMNHEKEHQAHGKKNYEIWKSGLQALENNSYSSQAACLQAVDQAIVRTWREFQINEQADSNALHSGGRR